MRRLGLGALALALVGAVALAAGPRAGLLLAIGIGFGLVLEGFRFGFAGPWRQMIAEGDPRGLLAQLLAIGLTAALAFPLLAIAPTELIGAHAPVGVGMVLGAFVFGAAMQVAMGCGSGTLVNAGSGNLIGLTVLAGFVGGAFLGTLNAGFWAGRSWGLQFTPRVGMEVMVGFLGGDTDSTASIVAVMAIMKSRGKFKMPPDYRATLDHDMLLRQSAALAHRALKG